MDLIKQKNLSREIKSNWEIIDSLEDKTRGIGSELVREMILQGQRLLQIKETLKHGDWMPWCHANAPGRYEKIVRCIRVASKLARVPILGELETVREALAICASKDTTTTAPPKRWPPAHEAILKLSKFVGFVERHPMAQWNDDQKESAREMLLPVAQDLWPERLKAQ